MPPELIDSGRQLTDADIDAVKSDLQVIFPGDYRQFLLQQNGGRFADEVELPFANRFDGGWGGFERFFELHELCRYSIDVDLEPEERELIRGTVCVAQDGGVGVRDILMHCDGKDAGRMIIINECRPLVLCDTFSEFWSGIRLDPEVQFTETLPAFSAVERNDREDLLRLLDHRAAIDSRNEQGDTLLICAARRGRLAILKLLLERGADVNATDAKGTTALVHAATPLKSVACVDVLLRHGAGVDLQLEGGDTLIMRLLKKHRAARVLTALLEARPQLDLDCVNDVGETALSCCAWGYLQRADHEFIDLLLSRRPNPEPAVRLWREVLLSESTEPVRRLARVGDDAPPGRLRQIDGLLRNWYLKNACEILSRIGRFDVLRECVMGPNPKFGIPPLAERDPAAPETSQVLRHVLKSATDRDVRDRAAVFFSNLPATRENIQALNAALDDPASEVRESARFSLEFLSRDDH